MNFTDLLFLFGFLPLAILADRLCRNRLKTQNIVLLIASIVFYVWSGLYNLLLLVLLTLAVWICARGIGTHRGERSAKVYLVVFLVLSIGTLAFFKYAPLFGSSLLMPLGLSFYVFEMISYIADVYRGETEPLENFPDVFLYTAAFFKISNGPIAKFTDIKDTLYRERSYLTVSGIFRLTIGLAKKTLLANPCGELTSSIFQGTSLESIPGLLCWVGMIAYTLQIYLDFSGYSDMAIGIGQILGIDLKENFDYPYVSRSVTEFWRRWHISLGHFFRDYVYIPLGGNRCGKGRQIFNLLVVWLLTGIWHGASANFVLWGLYYFVLQILEKFVWGTWLKEHAFISHVYLLAAVFFGWVLFYFSSLSSVATVVKGLFCLNGNVFSNYVARTVLEGNWILLLFCAVVSTPLIKILIGKMKDAAETGFSLAGAALSILQVLLPPVLLLLSAAAIIGCSYQPFVYAQF